MDTLKIKAFLMAEKYKSFSKAAEEFAYTPSAFSHIADSLEAELGVKLFHRTHRGVEITEEGMLLKEKFHAVLEAEKELYEAAATLSKGQEGTIRIGTYTSIALHILPEILNGFKKEFPAVKTSILVDDNLRTYLKENIADVIFSDTCPDGAVKWVPMMEDAYVAVVPEGMFSGRQCICREELYDFPFIRTNESKLDSYFDYDAFKEIIPLTSVEDITTVSLVKERIGVAVLPALSIKEPPKGVQVLQLEPKHCRSLGFAVKSGKLRGGAERFVKYLKSTYVL